MVTRLFKFFSKAVRETSVENVAYPVEAPLSKPPCSSDANLWEKTKEKWREVPISLDRRGTAAELQNMADKELLDSWEQSFKEQRTGPGYGVRGWYQDRYADSLKDKDLCDIGCGLGFDGIWFALNGARLTFVDIVQDNLDLVERICRLKGIWADYSRVNDYKSVALPGRYDAFLMVGSLIHVPLNYAREEVKELLQFLRPGGTILFLGYPKERFLRSGAKDEREFAEMTDGVGTPWVEWYDEGKIMVLFDRDQCEIVFQVPNFGRSEFEFNWFEIRKKLP